MKTSTEYLIVGAGIVGMAVAYNLAKKGARDVTVLEQKYLGYGSTGRCGSGIRQQYAREDRVIMGREAVKLWCNLSEELGHETGFEQKGYLYALYDEDWIGRYQDFSKMHNRLGVPTQVIGPEDIKEIVPAMNTEGVYAACYNATDGKADPFRTVCAYALAGKRLGVEYCQYTKVEDIRELPDGGWKITTNKGNIECRTLIVAAGSWSSLIGKMAGVEIPIKPFVEEAMVTEPVAKGFLNPLVNIKTPKYNDAWMTQTTVNGGIIFGWGHVQWAPDDKISYKMTTSQEYAKINCWNLVRAFPALVNVHLVRHFSGFYDVTPDREPIISQIPGKNMYVAVAASFMHGPIAGQAVAEMLLDGQCTCIPIDFCDIRRFEKDVQIMAY